MEEAPIAAGPLEASVREREAWCPVCLGNRPSLPAPAEGTCAHCYNHLMKPCQECAHYYSGLIGGMHVGMPACKGDPEHRKYDWHWARRNDKLCGSMGAWASFPNAELRGAKPIGEASRSNEVLGNGGNDGQ